jgi:hypothetical protein
MTACQDVEHCVLCKTGRIFQKDQDFAFKERTDKGYVFCHVTILMDICDHCGAKSWDHDAEAILDNAVRQEYERLLCAVEPR